MGVCGVLHGAQFPSLEVENHPFRDVCWMPVYPSTPAARPLTTGHQHGVQACAHPYLCAHNASVLQCACESTRPHVCTHACVWGPSQGPRSLFHALVSELFLYTWPGPCAPALCLPMCVHVCHCQASGVGGTNVSPRMFAPPPSIGEEGCGEGCCWVLPHPAL